jgi:hypothetical protein
MEPQGWRLKALYLFQDHPGPGHFHGIKINRIFTFLKFFYHGTYGYNGKKNLSNKGISKTNSPYIDQKKLRSRHI